MLKEVGPAGQRKIRIKGKEVIHSPGATLLVERRRSGAMDNFHLQKRHRFVQESIHCIP